jgi:hypothetical protein
MDPPFHRRCDLGEDRGHRAAAFLIAEEETKKRSARG